MEDGNIYSMSYIGGLVSSWQAPRTYIKGFAGVRLIALGPRPERPCFFLRLGECISDKKKPLKKYAAIYRDTAPHDHNVYRCDICRVRMALAYIATR
jgi:hypothetical protein